MNTNEQGTQATWLPAYATLTAVIAVMLDRYDIAPVLAWWQMPLAGIGAAMVAFLVTLLQQDQRGGTGWARVLLHRMAAFTLSGGWAAWAMLAGWTNWVILAGCAGTAALAAVGAVCQTPPEYRQVRGEPVTSERGPRTPDGRHWQEIIRKATGWRVELLDWEPWDNRRDGMRLYVRLPESGATVHELGLRSANIASTADLPVGCAVEVKQHTTQRVAAVDVMLRNNLNEISGVYVEPTGPASITQDFPVLTTPRGERLSICLRIFSMVIGGTIGSGKTTLLHRIIMWLARCTDTLIWIIDLNGGGVAEPWINPWANRRAGKPVVDWVADNEVEAATMVAVARAIAVDRKTNREAARRKRAVNDTVLPLDATMPGIVILTDEGGELRQAASIFGQLAEQGVARLAQIGRAEGIRLVLSVLRGTSDLTNKAFRVVASIRLCLRMEEHDEYAHVLAANPGKVELGGAVGAGFLKTSTINRPVLGRTVNVDLASIDRHAVACAELRPDLDAYGLAAAAKVGPRHVLDGGEPTRERMAYPAMQDAADGKAYTGRWDRYAAKLAMMRGEEYTEPKDVEQPQLPPVPSRTSALDALAARVLGPADAETLPPHAEPVATPGGAKIIQFPGVRREQQPAQPAADTAREQIIALVRAAGPDGIQAAEIERRVNAARSRVYSLLKELRESGEVRQNNDGRYLLAASASTPTAG